MSVLVVTGTGTGVGKTVVTAALASVAMQAHKQVAVVKPAQTGLTTGEPGDCAEVTRLTGLTSVHELVRFREPLAPEAAARADGVPPLSLESVVDAVHSVAAGKDLVLVEGAGGLLVRLDDRGRTLADLARMLEAPVVVVVAASLGTLNHTALTLEALDRRGLPLAGAIIGSWPDRPGQAERHNVIDLEAVLQEPLSGAVPADSASATPEAFRTIAAESLAPKFGGTFSAAGFRIAQAPQYPGEGEERG